MVATRNPTLRAQWLGKMLRDLREGNGLTLKEAAEFLQRSVSTLSRFESGTLPISRADVVALMNLYGVEGDVQRTAMLHLADEISRTGWWDKYSKDVTRTTIDYLWLESRAEQMRIFNPLLVTGILQTRQYAEEVIRVGSPHASSQQVERWVEVRMNRQEIFRRESPIELTFILDEAVLRRPVGGATVMVNQLRHLREMVQRHVAEVLVLPYRVGAYPTSDGPFSLLKMPEPYPEVVHVENAAGMILLEADDVLRFAELYAGMQERCLNAAESAEFIATVEKDLS